jgi:hypothetical protein
MSKNTLLFWVAAFTALTISSISLDCKPPPASTPVDAGKLIACVEGEFEKGDHDPLQIFEACPGATIAIIGDVLQTLDKRAKFVRAQCAPAGDGGKP